MTIKKHSSTKKRYYFFNIKGEKASRSHRISATSKAYVRKYVLDEYGKDALKGLVIGLSEYQYDLEDR